MFTSIVELVSYMVLIFMVNLLITEHTITPGHISIKYKVGSVIMTAVK